MEHTQPNAAILMEIIRIQTEIAKAGIDLGGVMEMVTQQAQRLTGAAGAVVEFAEEEEMVYRAVAGIATEQLGLRIQRNGSLSGLCVEKREILRCDDSEVDERVDRNACRRVGLRSMLVVPLNYLDTTVGVLKVVSDKVNAFSAADVQVLGLMSELIAAAMFHAAKLETNKLYYRATHDEMTGLANRALFFDRLRQCLARAERNTERVAILNLDMDGLKPINDRYGHRAGDAAIRELANRINSISRQSDTVARVGGDEFYIILSGVQNRDGVEQQCHRLTQHISQPFHFETTPLPLAASIGLALFPDDGTKLGDLLEKADQSMYDAKRRRKEANG